MNLYLQKKIIIVTGGASGIGKSICQKLAEEGAIPCILDNSKKELDQTIEEIEKQYGISAFSFLTELTDPSACKSAVDALRLKFGRIDGVVNNAGLNDGVSLEEGNYEKCNDSLKRNVVHYFTIANLILPFLKQSKGTIVNICSKVALTGKGGTSGYAAANGERLELTESWSKELSPFGIRVNAVVVAECLTPQYQWWIHQQPDPHGKLKEINAKIPLGNRMTTVEEIADSVLFLLSSKSNSINGQYWHVDGGYVHLDRAIHGK